MAKADSSPQAQQPKPYEITTTRDQMNVGPDGRLVRYTVVYYKTVFGDTGHIEIPTDQFTAENVRAMIEPKVDELLKLRGY